MLGALLVATPLASQRLPNSPSSRTSKTSHTCTCEAKRATSLPKLALSQNHRRKNKEADEKASNRQAEKEAYWSLQGGGFCRAGAKVPGSQHQQQQQLRLRCSIGRDPTAAAQKIKIATAAAAPPYPTTDVPWVVAAPAYRQLCALKGKTAS
ncbi:hypothetical protein Emag_002747 [Eimeria magna]